MNEPNEDAVSEIEPPRNNPYLPEDVQELRQLEEITPIPSLLPVRKGTKEEQRELDETAFRLRARQKTYRQIADRLAVSVSTAHGMVKRHLHYQRTVLKEHLADVRDYELLLLREVLPQHIELAKHGDPRALGQVLEATRLKLRLLKFANPTVRDEELDATDPTRQLAKGYDEELLKQQERRDWHARVRRAEQEQAKLAAVGVQASACSGESDDLESHEAVNQMDQQPKGCTPTGRRYLGDVTIEYRTIPEPEPNSVRTNPEQNPEQILQPVAAEEVARVEENLSEQPAASDAMSADSTTSLASLTSIVGLLLLLLSAAAATAWVQAPTLHVARLQSRPPYMPTQKSTPPTLQRFLASGKSVESPARADLALLSSVCHWPRRVLYLRHELHGDHRMTEKPVQCFGHDDRGVPKLGLMTLTSQGLRGVVVQARHEVDHRDFASLGARLQSRPPGVYNAPLAWWV